LRPITWEKLTLFSAEWCFFPKMVDRPIYCCPALTEHVMARNLGLHPIQQKYH
jgi:hypothetical protein